jgi:hypothetical protein
MNMQYIFPKNRSTNKISPKPIQAPLSPNLNRMQDPYQSLIKPKSYLGSFKTIIDQKGGNCQTCGTTPQKK